MKRRRPLKFTLLLSAEEHAELAALAEREGLSFASWIRRVIRLAAAERPVTHSPNTVSST